MQKAFSATNKAWSANAKNVKGLQTQASKLFKNWNKEVEGFSNEQMKELGRARLEAAQSAYNTLSEQLVGVAEAYTSVQASRSDQITFMSRDLTPEMRALYP